MRFLVDECTGPRVAQWLSEQEYDVFSFYEDWDVPPLGRERERSRPTCRAVVSGQWSFRSLPPRPHTSSASW
jgi:hypothetical protein